MKNSTALLGAAIGAGLLWLIKKNKSVSGVGRITATFGKKRLDSYFQSASLPDEVELDLTNKKGKYVYGYFRYNWRPSTYFWISGEDARYLSALCDKYDVEFSAWNGNVYLPTLHKKIVMDFASETERVPRI